MVSAWRNFKGISPIFHFDRWHNGWICHILCVKIDEDGDMVNKTIVSIQEIINETIISKQEKEDLANKEPNNEEGKGYKIK